MSDGFINKSDSKKYGHLSDRDHLFDAAKNRTAICKSVCNISCQTADAGKRKFQLDFHSVIHLLLRDDGESF